MAINRTRVRATPREVFAVLSDGWKYAHWVVGAKRIRAVDPSWPAPGSKFHHTVGVWPLRLRDQTQSLSARAPEQLILHARARPTGVARVEITLTPKDGGTEIALEETPVSGPAKWLHNPLLEALTYLRNVESLRRLRRLVEREVKAGAVRSQGPVRSPLEA